MSFTGVAWLVGPRGGSCVVTFTPDGAERIALHVLGGGVVLPVLACVCGALFEGDHYALLDQTMPFCDLPDAFCTMRRGGANVGLVIEAACRWLSGAP